MSGQRAAAEPYTTRFETEVTAVDGTQVWLEQSYFYAESGGQPADQGRIGDVAIEDVQLVDGEPVHILESEPSFDGGTRVLCSIDWEFRMYCMRSHTASHILYGAGRHLLENLGYGGFDIGERKVRVDLETETEIDDEVLVELDELVNRAVWESRPVTWESIPVTEAREREEIAFNEATEEGAFQKGQVRIVTIGAQDDTGHNVADSSDPWDVAACGGTHVRNTREVGPVSVLGRSNPGEGLTRIELAVGPRAIDQRTTEKRTTFAAKDALGVSVEDVPAELERLQSEREAMAAQLEEAQQTLVAAELERASTVERDGEVWALATLDDVSPETVGDAIRGRTDRFGDVVVAVGETDYTFAVVGATGSRSAATIIDDLTDEFGGGGGGSDDFAQGGGFDASSEEVVSFFD